MRITLRLVACALIACFVTWADYRAKSITNYVGGYTNAKIKFVPACQTYVELLLRGYKVPMTFEDRNDLEQRIDACNAAHPTVNVHDYKE